MKRDTMFRTTQQLNVFRNVENIVEQINKKEKKNTRRNWYEMVGKSTTGFIYKTSIKLHVYTCRQSVRKIYSILCTTWTI